MKATYSGKEVEIIKEIEEDGIGFYIIKIGQREMTVQKKYIEKKMKPNKPAGRKNYGSIGHLRGSKLGCGDHVIAEGQQNILTVKTRDKHDTVFVYEKLDGSNVGVFRKDDEIYPIGRAGYLANSSPFEMHHWFYDWAMERKDSFLDVLDEGERLCGEWLAQAHGTKYDLDGRDPFVAFDLMIGAKRATQEDLINRVFGHFDLPKLYHCGGAVSIDTIKCNMGVSGHGAEMVEGAVWRVVRKGEVDFLAKFVRSDHPTGQYLPSVNDCESVYNWRPECLT